MAAFVLRRMWAQRLLVSATLLTVLLATGVLAGLEGFGVLVGDAGIHRLLATTDASRATLLLQADTGYAQRPQARSLVSAIAGRALPGLPLTLRSLALSGGYTLPTGGPQGTVVLGSLDRGEVRLLQGSWPGPAAHPLGRPAAGGPVPVAVPRALGLADGALVTLHGQSDGGTLVLRVVGVYAVRDSTDRYWQLDPLLGKGVSPGGAEGPGYGPLLVDDGSFGSGAVPQRTQDWQVLPDLSAVRSSDLGPLASACAQELTRLAGPGGSVDGASTQGPSAASFSGSSSLPQVLTQLQSSLQVSRTALAVGVLQLVLLTVSALLLAARLSAEQRSAENALLRARGGSGSRVVLLLAAEAVALVLPAAVLAPLLAGPLVRLLGGYGPLAEAGVRLTGPMPASVWWVALFTAAGSAMAVLAPALLQAAGARRAGRRGRARRRRRRLPPGVLRGGADLALVGLAAVALDRLRQESGLSTGPGAAGGVDPVLVAAPALVLCAGGAVALRLLPLVAGAAERLTRRAAGLATALVGWRLSRRSGHSAGPVVLVALAVAIGVLALGQSAAWHRSQRDQAVFDTGADVRLTDATGSALGQGGSYAGVPGVRSAAPVARQPLNLADGRTGELLALDTGAEAGSLVWRGDLSGHRSAAQLLGPLADPAIPQARLGMPLPGRPGAVDLDISAALSPPGPAVMSASEDTVRISVVDRYGLAHTLGPLPLPLDGARHTLSFDFGTRDDRTGAGVPAYPLTLGSLTVLSPVSTAGAVTQRLVVHAVRASTGPAPLPTGLTWSAVFTKGGGAAGTPPPGEPTGSYTPGRVAAVDGDGARPLTLVLDSGRFVPGTTGAPVESTVVAPVGNRPAQILPAVVDQAFLRATGAHPGDTVPLSTGPTAGVSIRISAVVRAVPGTGAAAEEDTPVAAADPADYGGTVLVDLASYDRRAALTAATPPLQPTEWWLDTGPDQGRQADVAAALRSLPGVRTVTTRAGTEAGLADDPLQAGPQAALFAALALAALLVAAGHAAHAAAALRRGAQESALLRALGASRRLLGRAAAVDLFFPVLLGLGTGLLLGALLTPLLVPLLVLTPQALRPVPPVLVLLPVGRICLLLAAVAMVPLLVAAGPAVSERRGGADPARRLREREER